MSFWNTRTIYTYLLFSFQSPNSNSMKFSTLCTACICGNVPSIVWRWPHKYAIPLLESKKTTVLTAQGLTLHDLQKKLFYKFSELFTTEGGATDVFQEIFQISWNTFGWLISGLNQYTKIEKLWVQTPLGFPSGLRTQFSYKVSGDDGVKLQAVKM